MMDRKNVYDRGNPIMIDSGTFWRCDHGRTMLGSACWRCGTRHPIRFLRDWWLDLRSANS